MELVEGIRERVRRRRVRREATALVREARLASRRYAGQISEPTRAEIAAAAGALESAVSRRDHDAVCAGLARLDDLLDTHLPYARKTTFREYAESIAVAVLIALFLRAFVVEAFKIPSGSMIPTMEVGDHIFVNKFLYGIRIPFTKIRFFDFRKPRRGEVIVFIYPREPDKDFIKRIVAVEGDRIEVRQNRLFVNGKPVPHRPLAGPCWYNDVDEGSGRWSRNPCRKAVEELDGVRYTTIYSPGKPPRDFPEAGAEPYVVPPGHVFVMGDNRDNSHDSRYWGPVPIENIKGKALIVWWSSGGPDGIRWNRIGHVVD